MCFRRNGMPYSSPKGSHAYTLNSIVLRAHNGGDGVGGLELELYDATGTSGTAGSSIASLVTNDPVTNSYTNITFSSNK